MLKTERNQGKKRKEKKKPKEKNRTEKRPHVALPRRSTTAPLSARATWPRRTGGEAHG